MTSSKASPSASSRYYWVIVSAGFFMMLASMGFGRYAYPMLLPSMQESLGVPYGTMGLLGTVNLIGYLVFSIVGGILATHYGHKVVITGSMLLVGVSLVALGLASSYWLTFALMVLAGVGTAGVFVPGAGLARAWSPANRGGFTIGFLSTGIALGLVLAAFFIPLVLTRQGQDGWRYAWVYLGIANLAVTGLGLTLKEVPRGSPARGAGLASSRTWPQVLRNSTVVGLALAYFLFGFSQIYATFFVAYLRKGLGLPAEVVGNIWLYWAVLDLFLVLFWGWLSDRIGRKKAMVPCLLILVVSVLLPIFRQEVPFLYLSAMLYGASFTGPIMVILAAAGDAVPPSLAAASLGLVTAAFGVSQAISPTLAGFLIDLTGSFYPGFALSAAVMALSLLVVALLPLKMPTA